jgi:hypothetical protein
MKKKLSIAAALLVVVSALYASTTINGARVVNGILTLANGAILGTPASVNLTNATALPCGALPALTGAISSAGGTCTTTGGGGGLILVEQHAASASASLDFTTCVSSTYDTYKITLTSIIPTTNDDKIGFRFNTGSGFDSGSNYSWEAFYLGNATSGGNGSTSDTTLNVVNDITNANSYQSLTGEYTLFAPQSAALDKSILGYTNAPFTGQGHNASGWWVSGYYKVATAVTQFQVVPNNGAGGHTIASGTARCYGFAK